MRRPVAIALSAATVAAFLLTAQPAAADGLDGATGSNDGQNVDGTATQGTPGAPGTTSTASGEPNCTMSNGTPAYLSYEGLQFTTMEEQRTDIRPEEQRPGVYLHSYCGGEYAGFDFYPEEEPIDPATLARRVRLTPARPVIQTNPASAEGMVGIETWFWTERWGAASASATAGTVSVTVSAQPSSLTLDPGDGTGPMACPMPSPAYAPGADPATGCTHVYERAGEYTATATVVYDVGFTSNVGAGGSLGTITTSGTAPVSVREAQAIVVG